MKEFLQFRNENTQELQKLIECIKIGERYLEFIKKPGLYLELQTQKQACNEIFEGKKKIKQRSFLLPFFEIEAFKLMQFPEGDRNYNKIRELANETLLLQRYNESKHIISGTKTKRKKQPSKEKKSLDPTPQEVINHAISSFQTLDDLEKKKHTDNLKDTIIESKERRDNINKKEAVLTLLRQAFNLSNKAFNAFTKTSTKTGLKELIQDIEEILKKLKKCL